MKNEFVKSIAHIHCAPLFYMSGNPRGNDSTDLDDGFRHRILKLIVDQGNLTVDQSYMWVLRK